MVRASSTSDINGILRSTLFLAFVLPAPLPAAGNAFRHNRLTICTISAAPLPHAHVRWCKQKVCIEEKVKVQVQVKQQDEEETQQQTKAQPLKDRYRHVQKLIYHKHAPSVSERRGQSRICCPHRFAFYHYYNPSRLNHRRPSINKPDVLLGHRADFHPSYDVVYQRTQACGEASYLQERCTWQP